jgi:hypothetical protein
MSRPGPEPLYRRLLGGAFDRLPPEVRAMHEGGSLTAVGHAEVRRGGNALCRLLGALLRLPPEGHTPITVTFRAEDGREVWHRDFDGRPIETVQELRRQRSETLLIERYGPVSYAMAAAAGPGGLRLELRALRIFGIPIPSLLLPEMRVGETVQQGRFHFDAAVALPLFGRLIEYSGYLEPAAWRR